MSSDRPNLKNAVLAAVGSSIAISAIVAVGLTIVFEFGAAGFGGFVGIVSLFFLLPVTLTHALFLGVPAYLWLRPRIAFNRRNAMLAGAVIGAVPVALFDFVPVGTAYSVDGGLAEAVIHRGSVGAICGLVGALAGLIFRNETLRRETPMDARQP